MHALAHAGDDPEVVRDQDQRGVALRDERSEQIQDLSLDRHVERRRGLVGDQELRLAREGDRDHGALPHPAGELVRVVAEPRPRVAGSRPGTGGRPPAPRPPPASARNARPAPRGSAARSSAPGSGSSSGPGRSSRSRRRGSSAAPSPDSVRRSRPPNIALPLVTRAARGRIPISASDVTLLPQPDSPTIPSVSPAPISNEIPLTAWIVPRSVAKVTADRRPRAAARDTAAQLRVECFAQPVADEVEPHHDEDDREPREDREERRGLQVPHRSRSASSPIRASRDPGSRDRGSRDRPRR